MRSLKLLVTADGLLVVDGVKMSRVRATVRRSPVKKHELDISRAKLRADDYEKG